MPIERARKTNTITLGSIPTSINSVQVKRGDKPFFTSVFDYELVEKTISLRKAYDEIKVDYTVEEIVEYDPQLAKEIFNFDLRSLEEIASLAEVEAKALNSQIERLSAEGAPTGDIIGSVLGGFKSLTENFKQNIGVSDEPVVAKLTESVPNIPVTTLSTKQSEIETLTGKPVSSALLNAVTVAGNPKSIRSALSGVFSATDTNMRQALEESSAVPEKVSESVKKEIPTEITAESKKIVRRIMRNLDNPVQSESELGFGNLGSSFGNLLAAVAGKIKGTGSANKFGEVVTSVPDGFIVPEGYDVPSNIVEENGASNLNKLIAKPNNTNKQIKISDIPFNAIAQGNKFLGALTPETYVFENIDTKEELEFDLKKNPRKITTLVVDWSKTWSNNFYKAKDIHVQEIQRSVSQFGALYPVQQGVKSGIQWHYVIQKDGTIQRGRPISIDPGPQTKWNKGTIYVGFVAGYTVPSKVPNLDLYLNSGSITSEQWSSFGAFIDTYYKIYPGGEIVGRRDIDNGSSAPGFDVELYVRGQKNKTTVYDYDIRQKDEPITEEEAVNLLPKKISSPSGKGIPQVIPTKDILKNAGKEIDAATGKFKLPTEEELNSLASTLSSKIKNSNILSRDQRAFGESSIQNFISGSTQRNDAIEKNNVLLGNIDVLVQEIDKNRSDLINNGYIYNSETNSWSKK